MERHHVPEEAARQRFPHAASRRFGHFPVHVEDRLEHALGVLRFPLEVQIAYPGKKQAALQRQLAVAGIHPGAQPHHHVAQIRISRSRAPRSASAAIDRGPRRPARSRQARSELRIRFGNPSSSMMNRSPFRAAVGEIDGAGDGRAERLLDAVGSGVDRHREEVRVRAPVAAEQPAERGSVRCSSRHRRSSSVVPRLPAARNTRAAVSLPRIRRPRSIRSNTTRIAAVRSLDGLDDVQRPDVGAALVRPAAGS